jgi:apolipoprotein D and lipocalin family protein
MSHLLKLLALLGVAALAACSTGGSDAPEPAKPVELERYLGLWHEVARYPNRFEKGCTQVTAQYARRSDGLISVTNSCRTAEGRVREAEGRAKVVGGEGAKLKVSFFGPFFSDYWVLDRADDYSWAMVGDSNGGLFWILSRTPEPANLPALLSRAEQLGYERSRLVMRQPGPAPAS